MEVRGEGGADFNLRCMILEALPHPAPNTFASVTTHITYSSLGTLQSHEPQQMHAAGVRCAGHLQLAARCCAAFWGSSPALVAKHGRTSSGERVGWNEQSARCRDHLPTERDRRGALSSSLHRKSLALPRLLGAAAAAAAAAAVPGAAAAAAGRSLAVAS